jgi:hypothetical protein
MLALANAIFELLYPNLKTQAVFTVPTRAVTTDSGTEPSSSTAAAPRVTRIPDQMIVKFMHHKRLTIRNGRAVLAQLSDLLDVFGYSFT